MWNLIQREEWGGRGWKNEWNEKKNLMKYDWLFFYSSNTTKPHIHITTVLVFHFDLCLFVCMHQEKNHQIDIYYPYRAAIIVVVVNWRIEKKKFEKKEWKYFISLEHFFSFHYCKQIHVCVCVGWQESALFFSFICSKQKEEENWTKSKNKKNSNV